MEFKNFKSWLNEALSIGSDVVIKYPKKDLNDPMNKAFHGERGTVQSIEKDGSIKMYRVKLASPVNVPGIKDLVRSDLWPKEYLKRV